MEIVATQNITQFNIISTPILNEFVVEASQEVVNYNINVAQLGEKGADGSFEPLYFTSGESIPSHTAVAIYNNLAYKLDPSTPLHQFAFVGFSVNGTSIGGICEIKQLGNVTLSGWGLTPNQQYLAGLNGTLITENVSNANFTKVIGYAVNSDTLQIIKDSITINK